MTGHKTSRVPPFRHPRIKARSTTPRGISQSTTPFIGPWYQGIHRTPKKTTNQTRFHQKNKLKQDKKNLHHRYSHHYTNNNQPTKPHHTTKTAIRMQPARPISPKPDSAPTKTAGNVQCPRASQNQKTQNQHNQNSHALAMLPRKEVIQPHLPVRLPCYDFVPIANPTFDRSPQKG